MSEVCPVVIVGAGPYGLSVAAHLRAARVRFRIFGQPMSTWREQMPDGMLLKSDGFASNLSDPAEAFTLKQYCQSTGTPYDDMNLPIHIDTFRAYGVAFQQRMVPELEDHQVVEITRNPQGYALKLDDGQVVVARQVVLAVGITHFHYLPPELADVSPELLTHSSAHRDLTRFRGRSVTVLGGGASAVDIAVLLKEGGADVTLVARAAEIKLHDPPAKDGRSLWQRLRHPSSPIGPGLRSRIYSDAPWLFRYLPAGARFWIVRKHSGPAAGWPMKARLQGKVPVLLGTRVTGAERRDGRLCLHLEGPDGPTEHLTDHVIAATGYRVDLRRLVFLSDDIRVSIASERNAPVLSGGFQSSLPGLYFVGVASANSFGPVMRFACGATWAAPRVARAIAGAADREALESNFVREVPSV